MTYKIQNTTVNARTASDIITAPGMINLSGEIYLLSLIGPPASGKGTLAGVICNLLDVAHVSTGDILRKHLDRGTDLGLLAKKFMNDGGLVPDTVMLEMVDGILAPLSEGILHEDLRTNDSKLGLDGLYHANGGLIDGFPRTIPQAEHLNTNYKLNVVIGLFATDDVVFKRMAGRYSTPDGMPGKPRIYNIYNDIDLENNIDVYHHFGSTQVFERVTRIQLFQRSDAFPSVARKRIAVYHEQSDAVIDYFSKCGLLKEFNGEKKANEVSSDVAAYLTDLKQGKVN